MKILHNPRCRKSRETLALIEEKKKAHEIVLYLENPLNKKEITEILALLDIPAEKLIRKGESIFKELYKGKTLTEKQWIAAMADHPKLIERPIVIKGKKAIIGRPPSNVLSLM